MEQAIPSDIHPLSEKERDYFKHLTDTMDGWEETVQSGNVTASLRSSLDYFNLILHRMVNYNIILWSWYTGLLYDTISIV